MRVSETTDGAGSEENRLLHRLAKVEVDRGHLLGGGKMRASRARESREISGGNVFRCDGRVEQPLIAIPFIRPRVLTHVALRRIALELQFQLFIGDGVHALDLADHGADGDLDDDVVAAFAAAGLALAVLAAPGFDDVAARELVERGLAADGLDVDATSVAAVAAVGGAGCNIFLFQEGDAAVAAIAGVEVDGGAVGEDCAPVVGGRWVEMRSRLVIEVEWDVRLRIGVAGKGPGGGREVSRGLLAGEAFLGQAREGAMGRGCAEEGIQERCQSP